MTTARELMTPECTFVSTADTLVEVARVMRDNGVGAVPVCADGARLVGMVTDRDIVVRCLADGADAQEVRAESVADGTPVTIGADDTVDEALLTMARHGVRRLPVIDGNRLVGMLTQADVARSLPHERIGELVDALSSALPNN